MASTLLNPAGYSTGTDSQGGDLLQVLGDHLGAVAVEHDRGRASTVRSVFGRFDLTIANEHGEATHVVGELHFRRERMTRWILDHPEFDQPSTKGRLIFDLGRCHGSGDPAVAVALHPTSQEI